MIDIKWDVVNVLFCVRIMDGFVFGFICDLWFIVNKDKSVILRKNNCYS